MAHFAGQGGFLTSNPQFTGQVFGHSFSAGQQVSGFPTANVVLGPIDISLPGSGGCPPGTFQDPIFGTCVGLAPGAPPSTGQPPIAIPTFQSCAPGFHLDIVGNCVPDNGIPVDPTGPAISPSERQGGAAAGPALPSRVPRNVHVCPKFVDGQMGILYFNPLSNQLVCLPRSFSTKDAMAFGLIRKNKPRSKAIVTAADARLLRKISSIQSKIGRVADLAGAMSCPPKKKSR